jgi:predicted MPP superfamily phosphohydrolase
MTTPRKFALGIVGVLLLAGLWAAAAEPRLLSVTRLAVAVPEWPADAAPLTAVFATDLHVGAPHVGLDRLERIVARIQAEAPDIVLLGGDFVCAAVIGRTVVAPEAIAERLGSLRPALGTVAVLGNHDWWMDGPAIAAALSAQGIRVLENDAAQFGRLWVAGLADDTTRHPDSYAAIAAVPADAPVIGLMHDPANLPDWPRRLTLALAGHTHAGQMRLPGIGSPIVPGRAPRRHAFGLIREYGQLLYVSAGIGTSILPFRFGAPPELLVVTFHPAKKMDS